MDFQSKSLNYEEKKLENEKKCYSKKMEEILKYSEYASNDKEKDNFKKFSKDNFQENNSFSFLEDNNEEKILRYFDYKKILYKDSDLKNDFQKKYLFSDFIHSKDNDNLKKDENFFISSDNHLKFGKEYNRNIIRGKDIFDDLFDDFIEPISILEDYSNSIKKEEDGFCLIQNATCKIWVHPNYLQIKKEENSIKRKINILEKKEYQNFYHKDKQRKILS